MSEESASVIHSNRCFFMGIVILLFVSVEGICRSDKGNETRKQMSASYPHQIQSLAYHQTHDSSAVSHWAKFRSVLDSLLSIDFYDLPSFEKRLIQKKALTLFMTFTTQQAPNSKSLTLQFEDLCDSLDRFAEETYTRFLMGELRDAEDSLLTDELNSYSGNGREMESVLTEELPAVATPLLSSTQIPLSVNQSSLYDELSLAIQLRGSQNQLWRGTDQSGGNGVGSASAHLYLPFGFRIGWRGVMIFNQPGFMDQHSLFIGGGFYLLPMVKVNATFTQSFFAEESAQFISILKNDLTISLSVILEESFIYTSFSYAYGSQEKEVLRRVGGRLQYVTELGEAINRFVFFGISRALTLFHVFDSPLIVEPSFEWSIGTIPRVVLDVVRVRRPNGQITEVVRQSLIDNSTFAISNYDLHLTLSYAVGHFCIEPEVSWIIPRNQVDNSAFFNFALNLRWQY